MGLGNTRTSSTDDPHGHYLSGILRTVETLTTHTDEIRKESATAGAVKLRGCRYAALPAPLQLGSQRRVITSAPCGWLGYMLAETTGNGPLVIQVGDGDNSGDDPVGLIVLAAGADRLLRLPAPVSLGRGLVLTVLSGHAQAQVTGSVFLR